MNSNRMRVAAGALVVIVAVVLFAVLQNGGDSDNASSDNNSTITGNSNDRDSQGNGKAAPPVPTIVVRGGKPVGGIQDLTFDEGERIRFRVKSDVSDEIHVHGYDIAKEVEAGGSVSFDFPATIEGVFEAELEERGEQILELTVNP